MYEFSDLFIKKTKGCRIFSCRSTRFSREFRLSGIVMIRSVPHKSWQGRCIFRPDMFKGMFRAPALCLLVWLLVPFRGLCQDKFLMLEGKITPESGEPKGAYLQVSESEAGGYRQYTADDGSFSVKLKFQKDYTIVFMKKGFLPYRITLSTSVSKERLEEGISPYYIDANLLKAEEGFTSELLEQPAEKISYTEESYGFDSDQAYRLEMKDKLETVKTMLAEYRKAGKINAELAEKAKREAAEQAAKAAQLKKQEEELRARLLREEQEAESLRQKQYEDSLAEVRLAQKQERMRIRAEADAREAAQEQKEKEEFEKLRAEEEKAREEERLQREAEAKAEKEKRDKEKQAALALKTEEERKALEAKALKREEEEKAKAAAALVAAAEKEKREAEEKARKEQEEKERQEIAAKKTAEEKARAEAAEKEKLEKQKLAEERAAQRIAEEKAKAEEEEKLKKEREEKAQLAAAEKARAEAEEAKKKKEAMDALQTRLKQASSAAEAKRLEDLAKQEQLFADRKSKFPPVMGVYSNTSTIINGKKAYGYINFGNGLGNQDLTKEEYDEYNLRFKKEFGEKK
jgi:hypothetical protein